MFIGPKTGATSLPEHTGVRAGADPSPGLGEHNFEVLRRVGLTRSELRELEEEGIL